MWISVYFNCIRIGAFIHPICYLNSNSGIQKTFFTQFWMSHNPIAHVAGLWYVPLEGKLRSHYWLSRLRLINFYSVFFTQLCSLSWAKQSLHIALLWPCHTHERGSDVYRWLLMPSVPCEQIRRGGRTDNWWGLERRLSEAWLGFEWWLPFSWKPQTYITAGGHSHRLWIHRAKTIVFNVLSFQTV